MTDIWTPVAPPFQEWVEIATGETPRVTEDNQLRLLEGEQGYRELEGPPRFQWAPVTAPPATWT